MKRERREKRIQLGKDPNASSSKEDSQVEPSPSQLDAKVMNENPTINELENTSEVETNREESRVES